MMSPYLVLILFLHTVFANELVTYSVEINLKDQHGSASFDLWPIVFEYSDPKAFKAGNLTGIDQARGYVSLILTPYGQLKSSAGNSTGFSSNGCFGLQPDSDPQHNSGFSIVDNALYYQGQQNWTACPFKRAELTLYTIEYNSNCTGGYNTTIQVVGTSIVSTISQASTLTHIDSGASTTLSDNSFQSFTEDATTASSFAYTSSVSYFITILMLVPSVFLMVY